MDLTKSLDSRLYNESLIRSASPNHPIFGPLALTKSPGESSQPPVPVQLKTDTRLRLSAQAQRMERAAGRLRCGPTRKLAGSSLLRRAPVEAPLIAIASAEHGGFYATANRTGRLNPATAEGGLRPAAFVPPSMRTDRLRFCDVAPAGPRHHGGGAQRDCRRPDRPRERADRRCAARVNDLMAKRGRTPRKGG